MRIAVTGGRGRLAPALAHHLRGCGHEFVLFSRVSAGRLRGLDDLLRPGGLRGFDAVLHLGWSSVPLIVEQRPGIEWAQDIPLVRALVMRPALRA